MYDLIIIGSGPGGFEAIMTALRKKLNIAVVEKGKLGGNCLNRACIPTKYFWSGAHSYQKLPLFEKYGIDLSYKKISFTEAKKNKDSAIAFLRKSFIQLLKIKNVPVYKGVGRIIDKNKVKITYSDGKEDVIEGKYILIATGSKPSSIGGLIPDDKFIISTEEFLEKLETLPDKIVIIGGGVAGCELAYISAVYGSKVTIIELKDRLLPLRSISPEVSRNLQRRFKKLGINFHLNRFVKKYEIVDEKIIITLSDGSELIADKILLSVGRIPNTDIDDLGLVKDEKGYIAVNEYLQTSIDNIYACGDVISSPMLAHVASYEAKVAVHNMFASEKKKVDYSILPWAIYTAFEVSHVGLNEIEAKESGIEVISGYYTFTYNEKAVDEYENEGFVRLVFEKDSKRLIGATIIGKEAGELIHILAIAIKKGLTAEDLHNFIFFHPSLSEIFSHATYDVVIGKLF